MALFWKKKWKTKANAELEASTWKIYLLIEQRVNV